VKIWSGLHGDVQSAAEMTAPPPSKAGVTPSDNFAALVKSGYMLEHPSISQYLPNGEGDNLSSADNQQERLVRIGWILGFVDGEGCFSIGFVRQPVRTDRQGYKTGYQVFHEFAVTQGAKSVACLHELREFFGVGQVLINQRADNHTEHLYTRQSERTFSSSSSA